MQRSKTVKYHEYPMSASPFNEGWMCEYDYQGTCDDGDLGIQKNTLEGVGMMQVIFLA